jgi:hypothetical protein
MPYERIFDETGLYLQTSTVGIFDFKSDQNEQSQGSPQLSKNDSVTAGNPANCQNEPYCHQEQTPGNPDDEYTPGNPDEDVEFNPEEINRENAAAVPDNGGSLFDDCEFPEYFQEFLQEYQPENKPKAHTYRITIEIDDEFYQNQNNQSEDTLTEDVASVDTKDDTLTNTYLDDGISVCDSFLTEVPLEVDPEWKACINSYLRARSDEDRAYVNKVFPCLIDSLNEMVKMNPDIKLDQNIFNIILKDLFLAREDIIVKENGTIRELVQDETQNLAYARPRECIKYDELSEQRRKNKESKKGHKNHSAMNHMNENYVSNIFQFSKQHFPNDKQLQKIANSRNVSAANFKKITRINLSDSAMTRKSKLRILNSGKELVSNIEHWMHSGYFGQCTEREKYIRYKEKALTDLVLERPF